MEGRVYLCSWKRVGKRYRLWVKRRSALVGEGATFAEAREALFGAVCTQLGDGEAVFEFDPPEPADGRVARLLDPAIVTVSGNTRADIAGTADVLFEGGLCPECRQPRGRRTAALLALESVASGYEGGFTVPGSRHFFSTDFLALLRPPERQRFEWRPVTRGSRAKKAFAELIGAPDVGLVAMKGLPYDPLVQCDACGWLPAPMYWGKAGKDQDLRDAGISQFVCRPELPNPLPSCFLIGAANAYQLAFRRERWQELVGRRGTRGLVATPIGVVNPEDVLRDQPVKQRSAVLREIQERAERWDNPTA